MLTDKCKKDFLIWLKAQDVAPYPVMFDELPDIIKKTYIIEYFDSVGIHISIKVFKDHCNDIGFEYSVVSKKNDSEIKYLHSRSLAIDLAIEKANEIYNAQSKA